MVDPVTISVTAIGLAKTAWELGKTISKWISDVKSTDMVLSCFSAEIQILGDSLNETYSILQDTKVSENMADMPASVAKWFETSLMDCGGVLKQIQDRLVAVKNGRFSNGFLKDVGTNFKLNLKSSELKPLRRQVKTFVQTIQIGNSMIHMLMTAQTSSRTLAFLNTIKGRLGRIEMSLSKLDASNMQTSPEAGIPRLLNSLGEWADTASEYYGSKAATELEDSFSESGLRDLDRNADPRIELWVNGIKSSDHKDKEVLTTLTSTSPIAAHALGLLKEGKYDEASRFYNVYFEKMSNDEDVQELTKARSQHALCHVARGEWFLAEAEFSRIEKDGVAGTLQLELRGIMAWSSYLAGQIRHARDQAEILLREEEKADKTAGRTRLRSIAWLLMNISEITNDTGTADLMRDVYHARVGNTVCSQAVAAAEASIKRRIILDGFDLETPESMKSAFLIYEKMTRIDGELTDCLVYCSRAKPRFRFHGDEGLGLVLEAIENRHFIKLGLLVNVGAVLSAGRQSDKAVKEIWKILRNFTPPTYDDIVMELLNNGVTASNVHEDNIPSDKSLSALIKTGVLTLLLKVTRDPNFSRDTRNTALSFAIEAGYHDLIPVLLESGADVNLANWRGEFEGVAPLIFAIIQACTYGEKVGDGIIGLIRLLLKFGAHVDAQDTHGKTCLHLAAQYRLDETIGFLLEAQAAVNVSHSSGRTIPRSLASKEHEREARHQSMRRALLRQRDRSGRTALHLAAEHGHLSTVQTLLAEGASPNPERGEWIRSPLHYAVLSQKLSIVDRLVEAKADLTAQNEFGRTPLELARETNQPLLGTFLESKMREQGIQFQSWSDWEQDQINKRIAAQRTDQNLKLHGNYVVEVSSGPPLEMISDAPRSKKKKLLSFINPRGKD